jgi:hypothetical protein
MAALSAATGALPTGQPAPTPSNHVGWRCRASATTFLWVHRVPAVPELLGDRVHADRLGAPTTSSQTTASDVEDAVAATDALGLAQHIVVQPQFGIVIDGAHPTPPLLLPGGAAPRDGRTCVRSSLRCRARRFDSDPVQYLRHMRFLLRVLAPAQTSNTIRSSTRVRASVD